MINSAGDEANEDKAEACEQHGGELAQVQRRDGRQRQQCAGRNRRFGQREHHVEKIALEADRENVAKRHDPDGHDEKQRDEEHLAGQQFPPANRARGQEMDDPAGRIELGEPHE